MDDSTILLVVRVVIPVGILAVLMTFLVAYYRHMQTFCPPPTKSTPPTTCILDRMIRSRDDDTTMTTVERVHLIVIVHGWIGCPQDLAYIEDAVEQQAAQIEAAQQRNEEESCPATPLPKTEEFVVYNCICNHGKTQDGIAAGGDRVALEVQQVLQTLETHYTSLQEVTFSMIGYSMGGMYSRYALPNILPADPQQVTTADDDSNITTTPKQFSFKISPKVFCTMATPHLGSKGQTWFGFPRWMEVKFGNMSHTAADVFRVDSNLLEEMLVNPRWYRPLLKFEKRIAYANAYSMDFMIPTCTSAFLSSSATCSPSFHHVDEQWSNDNHHKASKANPCIAMVVHTPAEHYKLFVEKSNITKGDTPTEDDDMEWRHRMAQRLDAMGWTKVFCDFTTTSTRTTKQPPRDPPKCSYTSSELLSLFGTRQKGKHGPLIPMGHDLICANSKVVFQSYRNRRGRILVDQLAKDLIQDILRGPVGEHV